MLKVDDLKSQIQSALSAYIPAALQTCLLNQQPEKSEQSTKMAKEFAETFDKLVSEPLAESLANAIDYYIKNADITGTIITIGNKFTQTAKIMPSPTPITGGKIPNTFGIN